MNRSLRPFCGAIFENTHFISVDIPRLTELILYLMRLRSEKPQSTYPSDVLNPKETNNDVFVSSPGKKLHCHGPELLYPWLRPILQTGLGGNEKTASH